VELERYTDRAKGFLQSAQELALRRGHQRLTPEDLLKVLLEDRDGLCANLIGAAGGDPKRALTGVEAELAKQPKVEGAGAGQVDMSPEIARLFDHAEQLVVKAGNGTRLGRRRGGPGQPAAGRGQRVHHLRRGARQ
jgi:ATP-dependent Clp protease ATP-binding subunit ClpB